MTAPAFDSEQQHNAAIIVAEAKRLGLGVRAAEIGVMTADDESSLRNISGGDRDSEGLFQQRPSQGWGTAAQVTDPVHATDTFFTRLAQVPGWSTISPWLAAQKVQISAFADGSNYEKDWAPAKALADQLYGVGGTVAGGSTAGTVPTSTTPTSTTESTGFLSGATSGVVSTLTAFGLKALFLMGGVTLVVVGFSKAAEPAEQAAAGKAGDVAKVAEVAAV